MLRRSSSAPPNPQNYKVKGDYSCVHNYGYSEPSYSNRFSISSHSSLSSLSNYNPNDINMQNCATCRPYDITSLHQYYTTVPLIIPKHNINVKLIRIYHISRDDYCGTAAPRLELAVLDFLCPLQLTEESRPHVAQVGFNFEVRMGEPGIVQEEQIWLARAMIDYANVPCKEVDYGRVLKAMGTYSGPFFKLFKPVCCMHTVSMFLNLMNLDSKGYRVVKFCDIGSEGSHTEADSDSDTETEESRPVADEDPLNSEERLSENKMNRSRPSNKSQH